MKYKSISVFIPVYNEEENIKKAIVSIKTYLKKRFNDFEILVISDGSRDKTNSIVDSETKKDKRIKLISRNRRMGYGAGLRAGIKYSTKELIFYTDGDNQFNINDLDRLIPLLKKYDAVSAFRLNRKDPLMRIFIASVYNLLIKFIFGLRIKDIDASFKLYKKQIFKKMKLITNTGLTDAEILIKAKALGYKIGQIGVKHYPRYFGRTSYEMGFRNNFVAFIKPNVILAIINEIKLLKDDLKKNERIYRTNL